MDAAIKDLMCFLDDAPTAWHAVKYVSDKLKQSGFNELVETESWKLQPGERYFVTRNDSSLCAFVTPEKEMTKAHIIASHTDSPGFKLKPNPAFLKENMILLGVEMYGAPLIASWLNRDLGVAGRVTYLDADNKLQRSLIRLDSHPLVIPQLAIHLDRQVNENGVTLNKQEQLAALAGLTDDSELQSDYLEKLLQKKLPLQKLLSHDLFLFPLEKAALLGDRGQMIAAYRIDSLCSVHAAMEAIRQIKIPSSDTLQMMTIWDNEEIGSMTAQGAGSPFQAHVLERITLANQTPRAEYLRLLRNSLCLSVDLTHALHPNYSDKHEPRHPILMQHGVVIKYSAQHRYASDADSGGIIAAICHKNGIPLQRFVSRGDIPSGSTIGPIQAHTIGMPCVDIGCAQLSMHSCRELTACQDHIYMSTLLKAFFAH